MNGFGFCHHLVRTAAGCFAPIRTLPLLAVFVLLSAITSENARAQIQACCNETTIDRTCFDDDMTAGMSCDAPAVGQGSGTSCALDCPCTALCNFCVRDKLAGNGSQVEIELVSSSYDDVLDQTTFVYRICQVSGSTLSHWVLNLNPTCCGDCDNGTCGENIVEPMGAKCTVDPLTGVFGLKFDNTSPPACSTTQACDPLDCAGTCGDEGDLFTVVLKGSVPTGCIQTANKADGREHTSTSCIAGPDCKIITECPKCQTFDPGTGICIKDPGCCASDEQCPEMCEV